MPEEITQRDIDEYYHLLRKFSNYAADNGRAFVPPTDLMKYERVEVLRGLSDHLLKGGDYNALIRFSQLYGTENILPRVVEAIESRGWSPRRVIDIGCGLGWLGRGISSYFSISKVSIDKRRWPLVDKVLDVDTDNGLDELLKLTEDDDVLVGCEFLHCLERPFTFVDSTRMLNRIFIEYSPLSHKMLNSYNEQIKRFGCTVVDMNELHAKYNMSSSVVGCDPFKILVIDKSK